MTTLARDFDPETCRGTLRWDLHLPFVLPESKCRQDDRVQRLRFPCILKLNWTDCCKDLGSDVLLFVSSFKKLLTDISLFNTGEMSQASSTQYLGEIFAEYIYCNLWYRGVPITCCVSSLLWNVLSLVRPRVQNRQKGNQQKVCNVTLHSGFQIFAAVEGQRCCQFLTALELFSCCSQFTPKSFCVLVLSLSLLLFLLHFEMSWFMEEYPTKAQGSFKLPWDE